MLTACSIGTGNSIYFMKSVKDLRVYYPAVLVALVVLAFSVYSFYQLKSSASMRRAKLFEMYTLQASEKLQQRIIDYTQILRGCQSLFYSADTITSREWRIYATNLDLSGNYPGIQGLAYARYIDREEQARTEEQVRREYSYFRIRSSSKLPYLTPIIFIEPKDERNLRAFGFDMFSEANRRQAMMRAMLSGQAAMSHKVILVQETNVAVQPGFLLYLPVYNVADTPASPEARRKSIKGFVYIPFRAYDLMNAVFEDFHEIGIEVYDQYRSEDNLLYRYTPQPQKVGTKPDRAYEFATDTVLNIAGSQWTLHFASDFTFGSQVERAQPQMVLVFGAAISILLYLLTLGYINKKQAALEELNLSKEVERKKDEFIGIASHELKTPLTSIKAYLQMLARSPLGDKEKSFVNKASVQANKLNSLITDLLDVSKIQAGTIRLNSEDFKLSELINESVESVLHMYSSHRIDRPAGIPDLTLTGDKLRLEQALINLLVNAIKYSPGASAVSLGLSVLPTQVVISVRDQGIGISSENQGRIFEKFYRSEDLSPVFSGLGMGLFITYEIVRRHHGTIKVESELGKGSVFSICLPLSNASSESSNC